MILVRSFFAEIALILYLNKDMKKVMTVSRKDYRDLVIRVMIVMVSMSSLLTCIKHFSLTTVAISMNLSPIFTYIFGILILGETKATSLDIVCLILSMIGALCMILGAI
jgi:drug/metabolite transporter (DMT)-like permease